MKERRNHEATVAVALIATLVIALFAGLFVLVTLMSSPENPANAANVPQKAQHTKPVAPVPETTNESVDNGQPNGFAPEKEANDQNNAGATEKQDTKDTQSSSQTPQEPEAPEDEDPHASSNNGGHGQQSYDPLGTEAKLTDLSQTEKDRVKVAVMHFVQATYGYTGDDRAEYEDGVTYNVVSPNFYEGPGAKNYRQYADRVDSPGGVESTAVLEDFKIDTQSTDQVTGGATFTLAHPGGKAHMKQEIVLVPWGAVWRIQSTEKIQEESQ